MLQSSTIIHRLIEQAEACPDRVAFAWIDRHLEITRQVRYGELLARVADGAAYLLTMAQPGDRVLIFFEPGLDPLVAFLAVLAARMIAVPTALPPMAATAVETGGHRATSRLSAVRNTVRDCAPRVVFSSTASTATVAGILRECDHAPALHHLAELVAAGTNGSNKNERGVVSALTAALPSPEEIAFLQYTSGSTALPKGVAITHANIAHNQAGITRFVGSRPDTICVSWLPMFHDMGLVGNALNTIWSGCICIKLGSADFLRRPTLWMEAVSKFRGTVTGGPNFAFQLATTRGVPEGKKLDLSTLSACYCGSESVRRETLDGFASAFAPHGLQREVLLPCYGLAESTLIVTGIRRRETAFHTALPPAQHAPSAFVHAQRAEVVSCGSVTCPDADLSIRDTGTQQVLPNGEIGEICIFSRSVSPGYWAELKNETRRFADTARPLRTGDLGFLLDGELYVCGRIKNTVIVRGRKFIAEDLEDMLEQELQSLGRVRAAVFAVSGDDGESVVAVIECGGPLASLDTAQLTSRINQVFSELCGFVPTHVAVVRPSTLPRTTSGKLQRHACAELLQRDLLARTPASA